MSRNTTPSTSAKPAHPDDVSLVRVDGTRPDLVEQCAAVAAACDRELFGDRATPYSALELAAQLEPTAHQRLELVAVLDGPDGGPEGGSGETVVASGVLGLPLRDNPHHALVGVWVHPDRRRRGLGSLLLTDLERRAVAAGRSSLVVESQSSDAADDVAGPGPGAGPAVPFAAAHGYQVALTELRSDLDLPDDAAAMAGVLDRVLGPLEQDAAAHADGYDVLTWWDGIPPEWRAARAHLSARMSTDVPLGELDLREEHWDEERVLAQVRQAAAMGRRLVQSVAVHRGSGQLVAFTILAAPAHDPRLAFQWDTMVLAEHRGHRLGQLVKAANLRALLAELPAVRRVVTWNAVENEPMLRVNRAMGFRPVGTMTEWQKNLPQR